MLIIDVEEILPIIINICVRLFECNIWPHTDTSFGIGAFLL